MSALRRAAIWSLAATAMGAAACGPAPLFPEKPAPGQDPKALAKYEIRPQDLPEPNTGPDATNGPNVVPRPADATTTS